MKKIFLPAVFLLTAAATYAQQDLNTAADAVHYAGDNLTGTARFRGMSGAFGAVGGDVSAMMINPAGSALYNFNSGTASLSMYNTSNNANYFGTKQKRNDNAFDLNQLGAVFVFNNTNEDAFMKKFTLGFNYENTNNADNTIYTRGVNPNNSIDQYFLRYANGIGNEGGIPLSTLNNADYEDLSFIDQQAYLGYNSYIINPVSDDPANTQYVSNAAAPGNYRQENFYTSTGYNGKIALNFASQLKDKLYVGANVNIHFTDIRQASSFYEYADSGNPGYQSVRFDNDRYTYGGGFSFNLGAIYKITDGLRAGVAYESPTWLRLQDEITQSISSYCPECDENNSAEYFVTDPGMTFVFDDYSIKTPSKLTGSLAYIFGKNGLISFDYAVKDYSKTKYTTDRYDALNDELSNNLDVAAEFRLGAEYRIKNLSLRGGYRFEQSPYKNGSTIGDLTGITGGIGYSFPGSRIDFAYSWYQRKMDTPMFSAGLTDAARVTSSNNNFVLSYTMDL